MALTKVTGAGVEGVTISSTTDVSDQFILTNTNTGSSSGPDLVLFRQSTSSAADSDGIGRIDYRGLNDANEEINYATTYAKISDASDGTEDGEFYIQQISGGSYVTTLKIDGSGAVTKPLQPAFGVYKTSGQNNIAINSGNTITWDAEYFDQNADFASNTFTAPVTGKYLLGCRLRTDNVDSGATYYYIMIATSNRNYYNIMSPDRFSGDPTYFFFQITELTDMDANDTAYISFYQAGGTAQTDIDTGAKSSFWGHLVC